MNLKNISMMLLLDCVLLSLSIFPHLGSVMAQPRTGELSVNFYTDVASCYAGLVAGNIDLMAFNARSPALPLLDGERPEGDVYAASFNDPNIQVAPFSGRDIASFDFNNNNEIPTYPGVLSPMTSLDFRQAIAHLVDKAFMVADICDGYAEVIDVPIPASNEGWWNPAVTGGNYPYDFGPPTAGAILDAAGFDDDNPLDGTREYPPNWPINPDANLDPIVVCSRNDDPLRLAAAEALENELINIGIPVLDIADTKDALYDRVMWNRDYHIYTGGWQVERSPTYLFDLYHSQFWAPGVSNYVLPPGLLPVLDDALEDMYYAETFADTMTACDQAQQIMVDNCISVWLWSSLGYCLYRDDLLGVANMDGYGIVNKYTFMNAYRPGGLPIRIGIVNEPLSMNPLYSSWIYDHMVLDRIYEWVGPSVVPYDLAIDQPWFVQDWEVGTWMDGPTQNTKITYWFRQDIGNWVEPPAGTLGPPITAEDYLFTCWYIYAFPDCSRWNRFRDIHHIVIVDDFCVEVYMDVLSYRAVYWPTGPLLPLYQWNARIPLTTTNIPITETVPNVATPGFVALGEDPVWIESVEAPSGNSLAQFTQWNWIEGQLYISANLGTVSVEVEYWGAGNPQGYTPGGLNWDDIMVGCGQYYMTTFTPGVGATFDANPNYFLEIPPLGEVDWRWEWGPRDGTRPAPDHPQGPRIGNYRISIYDVASACVAFDARGDGVPDPRWFPGADLDGNDLCHIGIFDIVTIMGNFEVEFGQPP